MAVAVTDKTNETGIAKMTEVPGADDAVIIAMIVIVIVVVIEKREQMRPT